MQTDPVRKPPVIRPAEPADAPAIAEFIAMAESEMLPFYTCTNDRQKALGVMADYILSPITNRYSIVHHLVADMAGTAVGSILAFPADQQPDLDRLILEYVNRHGYDLPRLFFEGVPGSYYLCTAGVSAQYRSHGLGRKLIAAALEKARRLGFKQASLLVSEGKPRAEALYKRLGFTTKEEVRIANFPYHRMVMDI